MSQFNILIQNISYTIPNGKQLFHQLTLSIGNEKSGLIGKNGVGKSTLIKLISGELTPDSGTINIIGTIATCPQNFTQYLNFTIAEIFAVDKKITALHNILHGSIDEQDFITLNDDWLVKERINEQLKNFGLENIDLNRSLKSLSGGEITRLWLAKTFFTNADFIILDEPTNNLDSKCRALLYRAIREWQHGMLVVSHDRQLLELMDQILECTPHDIKIYGDNYSTYRKQKNLELTAKERQLQDAKKSLKKAQSTIQNRREKHEQQQAHGKSLRRSGSQAKILLGAMKNSSEQTQSALSAHAEKILSQAQQKLQTAKDNIEENLIINVQLPETYVPHGKTIVKLHDITFTYEPLLTPIIQHFDLTIVGPERIAIMGENGSGKTTLIKIIQQILTPQSGEVFIGVDVVRYLDQQASLLNPQLSILDNFMLFNPKLTLTEARTYLARFLFFNDEVSQLIINLSGGEKIRAALACVLLAKNPPKLLILDEPTNHLDLNSITSLESILNCYEGALIVISHDEKFIENIKITKIISAPFNEK